MWEERKMGKMLQKVISAFSYSGGTGKSTLTKELACLYAASGDRFQTPAVCLVDATPDGGSQHILFRLSPRFSICDLLEELADRSAYYSEFELIQQYDWPMLEKYLSYDPIRHIYILPSLWTWPNEIYDQAKIDCLVQILRKFFDVILLDTGNAIYPVTRMCAQCSSVSLMIVTDDKSCLLRTTKGYREHPELFDPKVTIPVLNRYPIKSKKRFFLQDEIADFLHLEDLMILPEMPGVWMLNNTQDSLVGQGKKSKLYTALRNLSDRIEHMQAP